MKAFIKHKYTHRAAIFLSAVLVLAVTATAFFPSAWFRDKLTTSFGNRLGREVAIEGPFDIQWRWGRTRVTAEKVRIKNAEASKDPYMFDIARVDMRLKILPLFIGRADIQEMTLEQPRIVLEKFPDGSNNWSFLPGTKAAALKETALPDNRHEFPEIDYLRVTDGQLIYRDMPRKLDLDLKLDVARAEEQETFGFEGKGTLDGKTLNVKGEGGSLEILRDTSADYPLELQITMGGTKALLDGTFRDPVRLKGLDARLQLTGTDMADIFSLTHIPLPPTPAYTLKGALVKADDVWTFRNFTGKVGNSDLRGNVAFDTGGKRSKLTGKIISTRLDVEDLGGFFGYVPGRKLPAGRLLPDVQLDLTKFRAADVDVTLHADKLNAPGWPLSKLDARFDLENGLLKVAPLRFGVAGGTVDGQVTVNGRDNSPYTQVALNLKGLGLRQFLTAAHLGDLSSGLISGKIALRGGGKTTADVLANSDGRVTLTMAGGRLSLAAVEAADLDIAELLPLLGSDKTTELRCAAGDFGVKDGLLRSRVFVIDTQDTVFKGEASVNLRNENINMKLNPKPKDGSLASLQSDVVVGGTFRNPTFGIDLG
ncbi:MAG: AsmA family protein, partial [Alphaproteobacteria bacterium]